MSEEKKEDGICHLRISKNPNGDGVSTESAGNCQFSDGVLEKLQNDIPEVGKQALLAQTTEQLATDAELAKELEKHPNEYYIDPKTGVVMKIIPPSNREEKPEM